MELLPCPFCGRKAELHESNGGWWVGCYYNDPMNAIIDNTYECPVTCETMITLKEVAIRIWNRRAHIEYDY